MWNNQKLPVQPFDKKIIPQFFFLILAMCFKMTFLLLVDNMLLVAMDEIYLYGVFVSQIFSLYFLAVAFSAEMIRWMRLE